MRATTQRGEQTRTRLLDAALQSFATRGFHGTSTRDIAEAAGMSPAAVYVHYRTKEELLFALSLAGHQAVHGLVGAAIAGYATPTEQLAALMREFTAWHARSHVQARVVQYELAALTPEHTTEIAAIRRAIEAAARSVVESLDVPDPAMTALAILSLAVDVARWYRPDGAWTPDEIGDRYADLALRMASAPPRHPTL
jgi:AcrR family transcriptional regulator